MANRNNVRGKVVKQNVNGTIFDVRQVPKYLTDSQTGKKRMQSSSMCLFIGRNSVKTGFKSIEAAGEFAVANMAKYNKKEKLFK